MIKLAGTNRNQIAPKSIEIVKQKLRSDKAEHLEDKVVLSDGLFLKAPSHFLEKTSIDDQIQIINEAHKNLAHFASSEILVEANSFSVSSHNGIHGIIVILKDRSFIVDTIRNYFSALSINPFCVLHPIFEIDSKYLVSLTYLEFELTPDKDIVSIISDLKARLTLLCSITDSFSQMTSEVRSLKEKMADTHNQNSSTEIPQLVDWLLDGSFIFLGTWNHYNNHALGVLADTDGYEAKEQLKAQLTANVQLFKESDTTIIFSKLNTHSPIHRTEFIETISFKTNSNEIVSIIGLFTSRVWRQEVATIPILRNKLTKILLEVGVVPSSHDHKELISLADTVPKSDFFLYSEEQIKLYFTSILEADLHEIIRVVEITDPYQRLTYLTTILPKERYSPNTVNQLEEILSNKLHIPKSALETHSILGDHSLVLIRSAFPYNKLSHEPNFISELEILISKETANWNDSLRELLTENLEEDHASKLYNYYVRAFSQSYKASHSPETALQDIFVLEKLTSEVPLDLTLGPVNTYNEKSCYKLRIYKRGEGLILSDIVPFLENLGLEVISEVVSSISFEDSVWAEIYDILICQKGEAMIDSEVLANNVSPSLKLILTKQLENDCLNTLLLNPGLAPKEIALCRAFGRYLSQIKIATSIESASNAFTSYPEITKLIIKYWHTKFNILGIQGKASTAERIPVLSELKEEIIKSLKVISDSSHDKIIRTTVYLLEAILRTNYYLAEDSLRISFKIDCSQIKSMPQPVPFREIFVSAPNFQGTHLRGGKVARGGLRWSSRKEDFRTEVLGLMKTQMVKNAIIVPVGAKGGFILHEEPKERTALLKAVENTYKEFIRSLLDITDNRIDAEVVHPANVLCYDEQDPYFVVAADRGTATFSDIANGIARTEYKFWLDDAFASGGSAGYDHKALGITAKGAWECTLRHFKELGINTDTTEFSVIGIGDMSGDVFGNGLILSNNAKLLAAFDHRHIFIDPNPDAKISFNERLRLFKIPSSSWDDYSKELLSKGGAVYSRSLKEINPSQEAREALHLSEENYSPTDLIKQILKAPCDLLWNGGIGTYVKASFESNTDANDRANDELRIDATELKARIVGEGGNLGFTQRARIEYSKLGGRLNTDAVDNSGGVDTSDLEVNLKLLFRQGILDGKIDIKERDLALKACEEEVCTKVKNRNRSQSIILSLCLKDSRSNINLYQDAIENLEKQAKLNRELEFLPSKEELTKRKDAKAGLSRPELAVLVAYCKMHVFEAILESKLVEDPYLENLLIGYFPLSLRNTYPELIKSHPLRKEIIATQICNLVIERMGPTFIFSIAEDHGANLISTVKAFLVSDSILNTTLMTAELRTLDTAINSRFFLNSLSNVQSGLNAVTRWFISDESRKLPLSELVERYRINFDSLVNRTEEILSGGEESKYQDSVRELLCHSIPQELSKRLCALQYATNYLDLIRVAENTNTDPLTIAHLTSRFASDLDIGTVLDLSTAIHTEDKWESTALLAINNNLRQSVSRIAYRLLKEYPDSSEESISTYFKLREELVGRYRATLKQVAGSTPSFSAIYVVGNLLRQLGKPIIS